jgi:hypothetical protein
MVVVAAAATAPDPLQNCWSEEALKPPSNELMLGWCILVAVVGDVVVTGFFFRRACVTESLASPVLLLLEKPLLLAVREGIACGAGLKWIKARTVSPMRKPSSSMRVVALFDLLGEVVFSKAFH